jgi:hypothetical protein
MAEFVDKKKLSPDIASHSEQNAGCPSKNPRKGRSRPGRREQASAALQMNPGKTLLTSFCVVLVYAYSIMET